MDTNSHVAGWLYRGLAAASEDPTADLLARDGSNLLLGGIGLAGETLGLEAFRGLLDSLWDHLEGAPQEDHLHRLRIEHCRLFQGPPSPVVSPYESDHIPGASPGAVAREVSRAYRSAGAALSPSLRDRPDHLSAELEFLGALSEAEAGGWTHLHCLTPGEARRHHEIFLRDHASRWLATLGRVVMEETTEEFYRIYGRALAATVEMDVKRHAQGGGGPGPA